MFFRVVNHFGRFEMAGIFLTYLFISGMIDMPSIKPTFVLTTPVLS
jgi:hypothetical protein